MQPGSDAKENGLDKQALRDLALLAVKRCREAYMSVAQLIDNDAQRYGVLIAVAVDMMGGCEALLERGFETSGEELPEQVQAMVIRDVLKMMDFNCEFEFSRGSR